MKVAARDLERMARPTGVGRALATYEIPIEAGAVAAPIEPQRRPIQAMPGATQRGLLNMDRVPVRKPLDVIRG